MPTQSLNKDLGIGVERCLMPKWFWTVNLVVNSVWRKDRCVLSHQDSKFSSKNFWKAPHSYSNRLTEINSQTKHYGTLTVDGQLILLYEICFKEGWGVCTWNRLVLVCMCVCVSACRIRVEKGLWHERVVKCPSFCDTWWSEEEVGSGWSGPCY